VEVTFTKELWDEIKSHIEERNTEALAAAFDQMHPTDIAQVFDKLNREDASIAISAIEEEKAAEMITFLDEDVRERMMALLTPKEIAEKVIDNLDSDDAADIISELPEQKQKQVLSEIEDYEQAKDIADLLNYDEDTAGGLMAKELVKVNINSSLIQCVREIRNQAAEIDDLYGIYVIDDQEKLIGILPLKKLLLAPSHAKLDDVINKDVISVTATENREQVAAIMRKYDLVVLPVLDNLGRLLGRITIDDVVDVIREEAEADYRLASGLSESVESDDKIWVLSRARLPWLLIGLCGGIFGSRIIGAYEDQLQIHPEMAFFIPLIAAMGGNAGVQSSAIIVQSLASGSIGEKGLFSRLIKEFSVAAISGVVCSVFLLSYSLLFTDSTSLAMTVGLSLLTVIMFASLLGTFIPLMLNKFKIDPALATGPFITTSNDILGLFVYFSIGRLLYGVF